MKKIIFAISALALMIGFSACQKDDTKLNESGLKVTATIENLATRADYTDNYGQTGNNITMTWAVNDIIFGYCGDATVQYKCTAVDATTGRATFAWDYDGNEPTEGDFYMFFMKGKDASYLNNKTLPVDLSSQNGELSEIPMVLCAKATVTGGALSFSFSPVFAIFNMNFTTNKGGFNNTVTLEFSDTSLLSNGTVEFNENDKAVYNGTSKNTISASNRTFSNNSVQKTYFAVPTGTYSNRKFTVTGNKTATGSSTKSQEITLGAYYIALQLTRQ